MEHMSVPPDLTQTPTPDDIEVVNQFLHESRNSFRDMGKEVDRLGAIRCNFRIHNGPNGILLNV